MADSELSNDSSERAKLMACGPCVANCKTYRTAQCFRIQHLAARSTPSTKSPARRRILLITSPNDFDPSFWRNDTHDLDWTTSVEEALSLLSVLRFSVVFLSRALMAHTGEDLLEFESYLQENAPWTRIVILENTPKEPTQRQPSSKLQVENNPTEHQTVYEHIEKATLKLLDLDENPCAQFTDVEMLMGQLCCAINLHFRSGKPRILGANQTLWTTCLRRQDPSVFKS